VRAAPPVPPHVMWHDVECGRYAADLSLWLALAAEAPAGVLDVGAGTGRVALALARAGHTVTALDLDPQLLQALAERAAAAGLEIATLVADAAAFELPEPVGLVAVPMQTIQLLPGPAERSGFFAAARRALVPGGIVALAIATDLEEFDGDSVPLPPPDVGVAGGWRFESQPVGMYFEPTGMRIERIRRQVAPDGAATLADDVIHLAVVTVGELSEEGAAQGLEPETLRWIPETFEHVAAEVVVFRG
jgi:SAM-dependent methyltransferase